MQRAARQGSLGSPPVLEAPQGPQACSECLLDSLFRGHLCLHELLTSKERPSRGGVQDGSGTGERAPQSGPEPPGPGRGGTPHFLGTSGVPHTGGLGLPGSGYETT